MISFGTTLAPAPLERRYKRDKLFPTKFRKVPRISPDEFMSPNASTPRDKQSLGYIVRSGIAGGVAGCVVRNSGFQCRVSPMCLAH